ncbi:hypothetical protein CWI56_05470, partial [Neisseria meningitidis]
AKRVWIPGGSTVQPFAALTELPPYGVQAVVEPDSPLASYTADLEGLLLVNGKPEAVGISHVAALSPLDSERKQDLAAHDDSLI